MDLIAMTPRGDLSSTGYVLAKPGEEYLILQPGEASDTFSVALEAGTYNVEWFSVNRRETNNAGEMTIQRAGKSSFTSPFPEAGPAVLYLKRT